MKVYIAGPITNDPSYKAKFDAVEEELKRIGLEPINPTKDAPEGLKYREYIDRGLTMLTECDLLCAIRENWRIKSKGARLECQYAETVGIPIVSARRKDEGEGWYISVPECWEGMFSKNRGGKK